MKKFVSITTENANIDFPINLRHTTNAMIQMQDMIEKESGMKMHQMKDSDMGLKELRVMLFCGLQWQKHDLTLAKTGEILDELLLDYDLTEIATFIQESIQNSQGKKRVQK